MLRDRIIFYVHEQFEAEHEFVQRRKTRARLSIHWRRVPAQSSTCRQWAVVEGHGRYGSPQNTQVKLPDRRSEPTSGPLRGLRHVVNAHFARPGLLRQHDCGRVRAAAINPSIKLSPP